MRLVLLGGVGLLALSLMQSSAALGDSVPYINGEPIDIQAVVGSGSNASYEVIDFADTGGPSFAWEYLWNTPVSGYQMLEDIAAATTLSVNATYYPAYDEHFVNNFSYDGYTGNANDYWRYVLGTYDSATESVSWTDASVGPDETTISNGSFDGWYNSFTNDAPPAIPTTAGPPTSAVPLPRTPLITLITMGLAWMLTRVKPRVLR